MTERAGTGEGRERAEALSRRPLFVTDVDGVLLQFEPAVRQYFERCYGVTLPPASHWHFEQAWGLPKKAVSEMWSQIWFEDLEAFPGTWSFLRRLHESADIVSLSSRKTGAAREASERELRARGLLDLFDDVRFVEPGEKKGPVLKALGAKWFLDDSMDNVYEALANSGDTKVLLMDRSYNQSADIDPPYTRVKSFEQVLRIVREDIDGRS